MDDKLVTDVCQCEACRGASTNPDTNQYLLVEPTEEMVEAAMEEAKGWGYPRRWAWHEPGCPEGLIRAVLRAALAAAQPEKKEG